MTFETLLSLKLIPVLIHLEVAAVIALLLVRYRSNNQVNIPVFVLILHMYVLKKTEKLSLIQP